VRQPSVRQHGLAIPYYIVGLVILTGCIIFLATTGVQAALRYAAGSSFNEAGFYNQYKDLIVVTQYALGFGAVITAAGFLLFARNYAPESKQGGLLWLVSGLMVVWAVGFGMDLVRPLAFVVFAEGVKERLPFLLYTLATLVGLAVWGSAYLEGGHFPEWLGGRRWASRWRCWDCI
jgi:hypothetical protein